MPIPGKKQKLKGQTVVRAEHGSPLAKLTEDTGGGIADAMKPGSLTGDKIAAGAISGANIGSGEVTGTNIAASTITNVNISDVDGSKISNNSITNDKIVNVDGSKISNNTITNDKIVNVDGSKISNNSITNDKIVNVDGSKIAAGSITAAQMGSGVLYTHPNHTGDVTSAGDGATTITNGAVTSAKIAANAVGSSQIAAGAVGSSEIATGAVGSSEIATGAVTSSEIATGAVGSSEIATGAVTSTQIGPGAVTTTALAPNSVTQNNITPGSLTAEVLDPSTINNLLPGLKSVSGTMEDAGGIARTLEEQGTIWCMVNDAGSADPEGPNTKALAPSDFDASTNIITIDDGTAGSFATGHGFRESGNAVKFAPGTPTSVAPDGLEYGTTYYIDIQDAPLYNDPSNTFKLLDARGGSVVSFSDTGTGVHLMSRETLIAFDAQDWLTTASTVIWAPVVNFQFRSVAQAYKWFVQYSGSKNMGILCGDYEDANGTALTGVRWKSDYNKTIVDDFSVGHGPNFEMLDNLKIYGWLGNQPYTESQGDLYDNREYKSNVAKRGEWFGHTTLARCRMTVHVISGDRKSPIWFRIFGNVKIANICWDFKIANGYNHELRSCFRCAHGLFSFYNTGIVVFSKTSHSSAHGIVSGDMRGCDSMEGAAVYFIAGFHMFYGVKSYGAAISQGGGGQIAFGTPSYIYTVGVWDLNGNGTGSLTFRNDRLQSTAVSGNNGTHTLLYNTSWSDSADYGPVNHINPPVAWTSGMAGE